MAIVELTFATSLQVGTVCVDSFCHDNTVEGIPLFPPRLYCFKLVWFLDSPLFEFLNVTDCDLPTKDCQQKCV